MQPSKGIEPAADSRSAPTSARASVVSAQPAGTSSSAAKSALPAEKRTDPLPGTVPTVAVSRAASIAALSDDQPSPLSTNDPDVPAADDPDSPVQERKQRLLHPADLKQGRISRRFCIARSLTRSAALRAESGKVVAALTPRVHVRKDLKNLATDLKLMEMLPVRAPALACCGGNSCRTDAH